MYNNDERDEASHVARLDLFNAPDKGRWRRRWKDDRVSEVSWADEKVWNQTWAKCLRNICLQAL